MSTLKLRVISVTSSLFYLLGSIFVQLTSFFCLLGLCSARGGRILLNYLILTFCSCKCPLFFCYEQFNNTYKTWTDTGGLLVSSFIMSAYYAHISWCKWLYLQYLCRSWYSMVKCRTWLNSVPLNLWKCVLKSHSVWYSIHFFIV